MLGLEIFYSRRAFKTSLEVDSFLLELQSTCTPEILDGCSEWLVARETWLTRQNTGHLKWSRIWKVWIADYPHAWLKEIAWTDWGIVTSENVNLERVPWVVLSQNKLPSRMASWKFFMWLRKNGINADFE